jgi:hypothetical protein
LFESAFKHGYGEGDFFEVLETGPLKLRSRLGLKGIYELYGRTHAGDYLHIAYRRETRPMKAVRGSTKIKLPRKSAGYSELSDFFDRQDGFDLLDKGITEIDPDRADLDRMLLEYWNQPNTKQLNIRIPPAAKRMIERLAKRKTVEVSTLVRMWVIDSMRREASQP